MLEVGCTYKQPLTRAKGPEKEKTMRTIQQWENAQDRQIKRLEEIKKGVYSPEIEKEVRKLKLITWWKRKEVLYNLKKK